MPLAELLLLAVAAALRELAPFRESASSLLASGLRAGPPMDARDASGTEEQVGPASVRCAGGGMDARARGAVVDD